MEFPFNYPNFHSQKKWKDERKVEVEVGEGKRRTGSEKERNKNVKIYKLAFV
jgi:hypothetical protein